MSSIDNNIISYTVTSEPMSGMTLLYYSYYQSAWMTAIMAENTGAVLYSPIGFFSRYFLIYPPKILLGSIDRVDQYMPIS